MQGGRAPRVGTRGLHREREGLGSAGKRQEPQLETGAAWGRAELHTQPGFLSDSETPVLRESLLGFLPRPGAAGKAFVLRVPRGLALGPEWPGLFGVGQDLQTAFLFALPRAAAALAA